MSYLELDRIRATPLVTEPFAYMVVQNVLSPAALAAVRADFPTIADPGLFPLSEAPGGPAFGALMEELAGEGFESALEEKFRIDLGKRPRMITVRGRCRARDGKIHTDTFEKILTILLYLNGPWTEEGGALRLLRRGDDIEDKIVEVPPVGGTLIAFKPSPRSWHGHKPFEGERRCVMVNWMENAEIAAREVGRHRRSAAVKRFLGHG